MKKNGGMAQCVPKKYLIGFFRALCIKRTILNIKKTYLVFVGPWYNGYQCGMRIPQLELNCVPDHGC